MGHGLVLEGGGGKGAYHIGAYRAIEEYGIKIDGIVGTSVGAINGAVLIGEGYEKSYEMWHNIKYSDVIKSKELKVDSIGKMGFSARNLRKIGDGIKEMVDNKGIDITPLKDLLNILVDEEKIRNSGKDYGLVTMSLTDAKPLEVSLEEIPKGELVNYIMASADFPLFKREVIDGKKYLDGGFYNNLPLGILLKKNYKNLILVRTQAFGNIKKVEIPKDVKVIKIDPIEELSAMLDFTSESSRYVMKLGYYDAMKAFKGLKGNKYYIKLYKDEEYFFNKINKLSKNAIEKIFKIFEIKNSNSKKVFFEEVLPKVSNILKLDKKSSYLDIYISLLENIAVIYKIERFKIYDHLELKKEIINNLDRDFSEKLTTYDKILYKVDILSLSSKDKVLKELGRILLNEM